MDFYNVFGYNLNGLEFAVYVLIPSSIFIMILLYIYANFKIIKILGGLNQTILDNIENENYHYKDYTEDELKIRIELSKTKS